MEYLKSLWGVTQPGHGKLSNPTIGDRPNLTMGIERSFKTTPDEKKYEIIRDLETYINDFISQFPNDCEPICKQTLTFIEKSRDKIKKASDEKKTKDIIRQGETTIKSLMRSMEGKLVHDCVKYKTILEDHVTKITTTRDDSISKSFIQKEELDKLKNDESSDSLIKKIQKESLCDT